MQIDWINRWRLIVLFVLCRSQASVSFVVFTNCRPYENGVGGLAKKRTITQRHPEDDVERKRRQRAGTQLHAIDAMTVCKGELLSLVQNAPSGTSTPQRLTREILDCVRQLEVKCPTPRSETLSRIQGTWELLWTAQDPKAQESKKNWIINPLENQSYSNNPQGRANPLLPLAWQDALERAGWVSSTPVRSTQTIDVKQGKVRNIVALNLGRRNSGRRASIMVDIQAKPDVFNPRRINVKFEHCRVLIPPYLDWEFSLGWVGPTGWIQNVYIDDDLRITRGHKGSVFVLARPRRAAV
jgi:PAP_fibrillin